MMNIFWILTVISWGVCGFRIHGIPISFENKTQGRRRLHEGNPTLLLVEGNIPDGTVLIGSTSENVHLVSLDHIPDGINVAEYTAQYKKRPGCCQGKTFLVMSISKPSGVEGCTFTPNGKWMFTARCMGVNGADEIAQLSEVVYVDDLPKFSVPKHFVSNKESALKESIRDSLSNRRTLSGNGVDMQATILFSDIGLDPTHCQLPDPQFWVNVLGFTNITTKASAHGTLTSSTAIGRNCGGDGGVMPGGKYAFLDLTNPYDPESLLVSGAMYDNIIVSSMGIHVHSASWAIDGGPLGVYTSFSSFIDRHVFENPGVVHLYAAGNDGLGVPTSEVGTAKNVLTVGALEYEGGPIASFTSNGDLRTGRKSPTLYAPGVDIRGAKSFVYPPGFEGHSETIYASGTSLSCPMMAAKAQMEIERRLRHHTNWTIVDETLTRAIMLMDPNYSKPLGLDVPPSGDLVHGETINSTLWSGCYLSNGNSGPFSLTMAWADPPGIVGADSDIVNDLDVVIQKVDESGNVYIAQDRLNVFEKLTIEDGIVDGLFRILVYRYSKKIISGPIRFSIHTKGGIIQKMDGCGNCFPGELSFDGCTGNQVRQCLPSGHFTECSSCGMGMLRNSISGKCECRKSIYSVGSGLRYYRGCGEDSSQFYLEKPIESSSTQLGSIVFVRYLTFILVMLFIIPG